MSTSSRAVERQDHAALPGPLPRPPGQRPRPPGHAAAARPGRHRPGDVGHRNDRAGAVGPGQEQRRVGVRRQLGGHGQVGAWTEAAVVAGSAPATPPTAPLAAGSCWSSSRSGQPLHAGQQLGVPGRGPGPAGDQRGVVAGDQHSGPVLGPPGQRPDQGGAALLAGPSGGRGQQGGDHVAGVVGPLDHQEPEAGLGARPRRRGRSSGRRGDRPARPAAARPWRRVRVGTRDGGAGAGRPASSPRPGGGRPRRGEDRGTAETAALLPPPGPVPSPRRKRRVTAMPAEDLVATPLQDLLTRAAAIRDAATGTRITWSPKVFIPLTMLCRDRCGYCTFAKAPARLAVALPDPEAGARHRPGRRRRRVRRGPVHARRAARGALPGGGRVAGRAWLRLHRRLPGGHVPAGGRPRPGCCPTPTPAPCSPTSWPRCGRSAHPRG